MPPVKPEYSQHPMLEAINRLAMQIIPTLMVTAIIGISAAAYSTYASVQKLTDKVIDHDMQIVALRTKIEQVEANSVRRQELLEILKRVEQQLEIALLRSGVKVPPKMLTDR